MIHKPRFLQRLKVRAKSEKGISVYLIMTAFLVVGSVFFALIVDRGKFATVQKNTYYAMQDSLDVALQQVDQQQLAHGVVQIDSNKALQTFCDEFATDLNMSYLKNGGTVYFYPNDDSLYDGGPITLTQFQVYNSGQYPTSMPDGISGSINRPSIFIYVNVPLQLPVNLWGQTYTEHLYLVGGANLASGDGPGTDNGVTQNWTELGYDDSWWTSDQAEGRVFQDPWRDPQAGVPVGFPDSNAEWIWPDVPPASANYANSDYKNPQGTTYHRRVFYMPYAGSLTIYYDTDNTGVFYIDGQEVGSNLTDPYGLDTHEFTVPNLSAGEHVLAVEVNHFDLENNDHASLGGFVLAAYTDNGLLFDTQGDGTWKTSGYQEP